VSLRAGRDAAAQSASEAAVAAGGGEERRRTAASALERIESLSNEAAKRVESLQTQIQSAAAEKTAARSENLQIGRPLAGAGRGESYGRSRRRGNCNRVRSGRARIAEIDQELKVASMELDSAREPSRTGTCWQSYSLDIGHMAESCLNELRRKRDRTARQYRDRPG